MNVHCEYEIFRPEYEIKFLEVNKSHHKYLYIRFWASLKFKVTLSDHSNKFHNNWNKYLLTFLKEVFVTSILSNLRFNFFYDPFLK